MASFLPPDVILSTSGGRLSCNTVTSSVHQTRSSWDKTRYSRSEIACLSLTQSPKNSVVPHSSKTWFTHTKTHHKSKDAEAEEEEEEEKAEEEDEKEVDSKLLLLHVFTRFLNHFRFISRFFSDCQEAPGGLVCPGCSTTWFTCGSSLAPPTDSSMLPWPPPVWPTAPPNSRTSTSKVQKKRTAESPSAGNHGHHPCES